MLFEVASKTFIAMIVQTLSHADRNHSLFFPSSHEHNFIAN